jgi:DNA-binding response OmpR family regulator
MEGAMEVLLLTSAEVHGAQAVLPALDLLPCTVRIAPRDVRAIVAGSGPDVLMLDARIDLAEARSTARMLRATGLRVPLIAVVSDSSMAAINPDWGLDDIVLATAGPAEVEVRLRLATSQVASPESGNNIINGGDLVIDPDTYSAKLKGRPLDLTYKEFELLKFLAQHPGRVFTRDQLLREVWGYDYFGGTRTVDVHVRRLRAKLGSEYEAMIGTVRQVGYKFVAPTDRTMRDIDDFEPAIRPRVAVEL